MDLLDPSLKAKLLKLSALSSLAPEEERGFMELFSYLNKLKNFDLTQVENIESIELYGSAALRTKVEPAVEEETQEKKQSPSFFSSPPVF